MLASMTVELGLVNLNEAFIWKDCHLSAFSSTLFGGSIWFTNIALGADNF